MSEYPRLCRDTDRLLRGVLNDLVSIGESGLPGPPTNDALPTRSLFSSASLIPTSEQSPTDRSGIPTSGRLTVHATPSQLGVHGGYAAHDPTAEAYSFFALPIHAEELGSFPLNHGFNPLFPAFYGTGIPRQGFPPPFDILAATEPVAGPSAISQGESLQGTAMDAVIPDVNAPEFSMRAEDLNELLSIVTAPSLGEQQQPSPEQADAAPTSTSADGDPDVAMSAESMMFADNMMEMWSTAPTSFK